MDRPTGDQGMIRRYYERRAAGQQHWVSKLRDSCANVSASEEYESNGGDGESETTGALLRHRALTEFLVITIGMEFSGSK